MKVAKWYSAAVSVAATMMVVGTGVTTAAPVSPSAPVPVYGAKVVDGGVLATVRNGAFAVAAPGRGVRVHDRTGRVVASLPAVFTLNGLPHPIREDVSADGHTVRLTPVLARAERRTQVAQAVASPLENQLAMNDLINDVNLGISVGGLLGTVVGAVAGVGIGFIVSSASCVALSLGCVLVVMPVMTALGAGGGVVGLAVGGAPGLAAGLWNYVGTLVAPPGTSIYASQIPALRPTGPLPQGGRR